MSLSWLGYAGVYSLQNRQWTLILKNGSSHVLLPRGTSESSGSLSTLLKEVSPGKTEKFIWKKTTGAWLGAVGTIHFNIGDTGNILSVLGCIPMDMTWNKARCNLHVGRSAMSTTDMEDGTGGCNKPEEAGQVGYRFNCNYTIANAADAEFKVEFNCKCGSCEAAAKTKKPQSSFW